MQMLLLDEIVSREKDRYLMIMRETPCREREPRARQGKKSVLNKERKDRERKYITLYIHNHNNVSYKDNEITRDICHL